jgi:adenylosuccinate synthase
MPGAVVFEGAQGVLLDEWRGFHPYTTWSTCTPDNALGLLAEHGYHDPSTVFGVLRSYTSRHGAGPMPTEDPGFLQRCPEAHNTTHPWQGAFRAGPLDLVLTRYALAASKHVHALAVTHLDRLVANAPWPTCARYQDTDALPLGPFMDLHHQERLTNVLLAARPVLTETTYGHPEAFLDALEGSLGRPVALGSSGPRWDQKVLRGPTLRR